MQTMVKEFIFVFMIVMTLLFINPAYAAQTAYPNLQTANIAIKIKGAPSDNRYFICINNIGCLSILAAEKGKIYPMIHSFEIEHFFITDLSNKTVYLANMPASCHQEVNLNQTLVIQGHIKKGSNNNPSLNDVSCTIKS